ncbi:auxin-responsive protein SAUR76 [Rhodamnia argentea]|uniref:Auxin-responsive protein SAUR76 n=1 Tax=Rhodamnia argentea TaxID=178133 RepID=A0ABM3H260_9MYRT|nr:auxin-responsive protein SAUR76 [Rhodamnia argentea]
MKKINQLILRKCKSLSRQLARSSSYSNLRSKSARDVELWCGMRDDRDEPRETVLVGSSRKRYVISSKHLSHPLLSALIQKSSSSSSPPSSTKQKPGDGDGVIQVKCEVVLFDHLLWMLDNADPSIGPESLEELAELYVF